MRKANAKVVALEQTVADGDDGAEVLASAPSWDEAETAIRLARPVMRDHQLVGPGVACIYCGKTDHQFHVEASKDSNGTWQGPEAIHIQDLIAQGVVAGTPEEKLRDVRQTGVEIERGVYAPAEYDGEGKLLRKPFEELREQTLEDVQALWSKSLEGGPEAVIAREVGERREAVTDITRLGSTLGAAIRDAMLKPPPSPPTEEGK